MAAKLDLIVGGGAMQPSASPTDQASHAAAPAAHAAAQAPTAASLVITLAVILGVFYALHIWERVAYGD